MGLKKWLYQDNGSDDPVARERVDTKGTYSRSFFEKIGDTIKEHPEMIAAGAAAIGGMNGGFNTKQLVLIAGAGLMAYKMYQHHEDKKNGNTLTQKVAKGIGDVGEGAAKRLDEYKRDVFAKKQTREEMFNDMVNPRGRLSSEYRVSDVQKMINEVTPYRSTTTYKNMSDNDKAMYDTYSRAKSEHIGKYVEAFAKNGARFEDCKFYDLDGKVIHPFKSFEPNGDDPTSKANMTGEIFVGVCNDTIRNALIYGMDEGIITCEFPNGEKFNPKKAGINSDYAMKNRDDYLVMDKKFANAEADISKEVCDNFKGMKQHELYPYTPANLSEDGRNRMIEEAVSVVSMSSMCDSVKANSYEACENFINPYVAILDDAGAYVPDFYAVHNPEPAKESENYKGNTVVDIDDDDISKATNDYSDDKYAKYSKGNVGKFMYDDVPDADFREVSHKSTDLQCE